MAFHKKQNERKNKNFNRNTSLDERSSWSAGEGKRSKGGRVEGGGGGGDGVNAKHSE